MCYCTESYQAILCILVQSVMHTANHLCLQIIILSTVSKTHPGFTSCTDLLILLGIAACNSVTALVTGLGCVQQQHCACTVTGVVRRLSENGALSPADSLTPAASGTLDGMSEVDRKQRELYTRQQQLLREQRTADQEKLLATISGLLVAQLNPCRSELLNPLITGNEQLIMVTQSMRF